MEGKNLNYQFSVFGDFTDITPNNSQIIIDLLSMYKDKNFIPSIFQEIPFNIISGKNNNRIMLSNNDGWQMNIGNARLDLSITPDEKSKYYNMDLNQIIKEACDIIATLLEKYEKKCNRIALNTMFLFDKGDSIRIENKYQTKGRLIAFYNTNISEEWNERIISQVVNEEFNNEIINVGVNLIRGEGEFTVLNKIIPFNGISMQIDINTTPTITTHRFGTMEIKKFFEIAVNYKNTIESDIEELLK